MNKLFTKHFKDKILRRFLYPYHTQTNWDYSRDALALANSVDCNDKDLVSQQQHPERVSESINQRVCNWYLPVFSSAFYGGVMTILRLANHLLVNDGVRQRFLICGSCDATDIANRIAEAFPDLAGSEILILNSEKAINEIPASDYSVATLWTTAYVLLKVRNTGYKFYMIQDFEPLFYPAGSTYAQAELTYRFGFYGIANTQTLDEIYSTEYKGRSTVLSPSVDTSIFYRGPELSCDSELRLFFYARPGMPRNCFELAVPALRIVKQRLGERIKIICAGQSWHPSRYGLENLVDTIGMLPYSKTGDLYRSCHLGLSMMMTPHPSYLPFEMMGCGTLVVAIRNSANTWLLRDRENCLIAEPTASCLADTIVDALENYEKYEPLRKNAANLILESFSDWNSSLRDVASFMHAPE